ncbi:MAG: hypothetical protein HY762_06655 [Planctomycetes bacterium]|nr:hypothetical protein [Planctomycetota bacterium]
MRYLILILVILACLLAFFLVFGRSMANEDSSLDELPLSVSSGRYAELLRKYIKLELRLTETNLYIDISNLSDKHYIPAEEPHRAVVCYIEFLDEQGSLVKGYQEYFKPLPKQLWGTMPTTQIKPSETVTLNYNIPDGLHYTRVRLTYEDLAKQTTYDARPLMLAEKEIRF